MTYRVKWVEDNLGVSRKALRIYEEMGLMPKNEDGQYREYDDTDIDRIWTIKQFQGMGYRLKEIPVLLEADEDYFKVSLDDKIHEIESRIDEEIRLLKYARMIQLTGRIPSLRSGDNYIPFDEFLEQNKSEWNTDLFSDEYLKLIDKVVGRNSKSITANDIDNLFASLQVDDESEMIQAAILDSALLELIAKRSNLSPSHPEVQLLVSFLYENLCEKIVKGKASWNKDTFVKLYTLTLIGGDLAKAHIDKLGREGCRFASDAIAIFCGYSNIVEAIEGE